MVKDLKKEAVIDRDDEELPRTYRLILIDESNVDSEWEVEYRTRINVIEMADILQDYFGIDAQALPKIEGGVIGYVDLDELFDEDEE